MDFDSEKQKQHEKHLVEKGIVTQNFLDESKKKLKAGVMKKKTHLFMIWKTSIRN